MNENLMEKAIYDLLRAMGEDLLLYLLILFLLPQKSYTYVLPLYTLQYYQNYLKDMTSKPKDLTLITTCEPCVN